MFGVLGWGGGTEGDALFFKIILIIKELFFKTEKWLKNKLIKNSENLPKKEFDHFNVNKFLKFSNNLIKIKPHINWHQFWVTHIHNKNKNFEQTNKYYVHN